MNMKKIFMLLLAVMPLLTMSCSKEDGDVENPLLSRNYEYSGTMTVTADGIDNVSEEVKVEVRIDETAKTLDIMFYKVKFVPQMPVSLDVSVPGVGFEVKNGTIELSADGIVPLSGGTLPFPKYTVTGLSGTLTDSGILMKLNFGKYPVAYEGQKLAD